ncbi:tyrosine aminotransferase [Kwoniella dejecticola CBS 10117]|uniref:Tyrosine aminotransferase n=1 Tax=Kwoniella dejecticola CBS 10117 TaxID=1296121 RepID=A0A1A5ZTP4_9TREE|nr:tyrosine aminotransferase [Kwoniella dejecticola CBS 10117]OBR81188.1 tyrosine aminotransferase [Kwoniella dejecticola CBS 10117]
MPDIQLIRVEDAAATHPAKRTSRKSEKQWNVRVSPSVARSKNPIRETLASITANIPSSSKTPINLGLGDPTHYPLHPPPAAAIAAVEKAVVDGQSNGYLNGVGSSEARKAVVEYHARWDQVQYGIDDVVLTHGVGQGLDLVFSVMIPPASVERSNILLPRPGFAQYTALLANLDVEIRYYDCVKEKDWEVDLDMLDDLCDDETRAILVNNPSNPCGSNYSREALKDILALAEKHKVPIIADEIYGHMTWSSPFTPLASLSTSVPIITLSGLSKRFLVPGWRFGWMCLHDPLGVATSVKKGIQCWGNRFMGPNSLIQAALPTILATEPEWYDEVINKIEALAKIVHKGVTDAPGLSAAFPSGAMYCFVKIEPGAFPDLADDVAFATALYNEQAVFVLPGICFGMPGYFRIVLGTPSDVMMDVVERLQEFCERHNAL